MTTKYQSTEDRRNAYLQKMGEARNSPSNRSSEEAYAQVAMGRRMRGLLQLERTTEAISAEEPPKKTPTLNGRNKSFDMIPIYFSQHGSPVYAGEDLDFFLEIQKQNPRHVLLKVEDTFFLRPADHPRFGNRRVRYSSQNDYVYNHSTGEAHKIFFGVIPKNQYPEKITEGLKPGDKPIWPPHNMCADMPYTTKKTCGGWKGTCWTTSKQIYPFSHLREPECLTLNPPSSACPVYFTEVPELPCFMNESGVMFYHPDLDHEKGIYDPNMPNMYMGEPYGEYFTPITENEMFTVMADTAQVSADYVEIQFPLDTDVEAFYKRYNESPQLRSRVLKRVVQHAPKWHSKKYSEVEIYIASKNLFLDDRVVIQYKYILKD